MSGERAWRLMIFEESARWYERARKVIPGGINSNVRAQSVPVPLFYERGEAGHIRDLDGPHQQRRQANVGRGRSGLAGSGTREGIGNAVITPIDIIRQYRSPPQPVIASPTPPAAAIRHRKLRKLSLRGTSPRVTRQSRSCGSNQNAYFLSRNELVPPKRPREGGSPSDAAISPIHSPRSQEIPLPRSQCWHNSRQF